MSRVLYETRVAQASIKALLLGVFERAKSAVVAAAAATTAGDVAIVNVTAGAVAAKTAAADADSL